MITLVRDITSTKKLTFMTSYDICPSVSSAGIFTWELPAFERSHCLACMLRIRLSSLNKPFTTSIGRRNSPHVFTKLLAPYDDAFLTQAACPH